MINRIIFPLALIKIISVLGRNFSCFYCEKCIYPNTGYAYCPENYERCYTGYRDNSVFRGCASKKCIPVSFTGDDDYSIIECCFEPFCNHWNLTFPVNGLPNDLVDSFMVDFYETTEKQRLYGYRFRSERTPKTTTTESSGHVADVPQLLSNDSKLDSGNYTSHNPQNSTSLSVLNISTATPSTESEYLPLFEVPLDILLHKQDIVPTNISATEPHHILHTENQPNGNTDEQTDAGTAILHTLSSVESEQEKIMTKSDVADRYVEKNAADDEASSVTPAPETSPTTHQNAAVVQVADNSDSSNANDDEEDDDVEKKKHKPDNAAENSGLLRTEWKVFQRFHPKQDDSADGAVMYAFRVSMLLPLLGLFL